MTKIFNFHPVAQLGSSRGIDGGIKFVGREEVFAYLLQKGHVFVKMKDGSPVPLFIENAEEKGDFILHLEGINTPEEARNLTGCRILVEEQEFEDHLRAVLEASDLEYTHLIGLVMKDLTSGFEGLIEDVQSYPQQEMAILSSGHLVPLNEDFIQSVDKIKNTLFMELPEGLFDE